MDKKPYTAPEMRICMIQTEATFTESYSPTATGSEGFGEEDWD